ncbi:MAG: hypothetical protein HY657_09560 [Acidobacteria bacterium]|nr:hypothetical protein [Acidobacteriota bacterium]
MSLATGARLGPYEISADIGAGGMGVVYRAREPSVFRLYRRSLDQLEAVPIPGPRAPTRWRPLRAWDEGLPVFVEQLVEAPGVFVEVQYRGAELPEHTFRLLLGEIG